MTDDLSATAFRLCEEVRNEISTREEEDAERQEQEDEAARVADMERRAARIILKPPNHDKSE
jgi:hypothetical protein